jgi:hypothetical protein
MCRSVNIMVSPAETLLIQASLQIQSALEAILFSTSCIGGSVMPQVPGNITLPNTNITATPDTPINGTNFPLGNAGNGGNGDNGDNGTSNTTDTSNNITTPDTGDLGGNDASSPTLLPVSQPTSTAASDAVVTSVAAYSNRLSKSPTFKGWKGYGSRFSGW